MIRPLTFLSLMAAAGAGLHLYAVKHEVSQLEKTLRETVRQTEVARERTAVLRAEWALLNEPIRPNLIVGLLLVFAGIAIATTRTGLDAPARGVNRK